MPFSQKEYMKEYRIQYEKDNKEKIKAYMKKYRQTPTYKKNNMICKWKRRGLICDNYLELYDKYLLAEYCDICNNKFKSTFDRCMDHDHETGLFRQFLCRSCNNKDNWKKYL